MNTTIYFRFVALFVAAFFSLLHPMASVKSDRRFNVVRVLPGDLSGDGLQVYERIRELHQAAFLLGEDTRVEYPHKMLILRFHLEQLLFPSLETRISMGVRFVWSLLNTSCNRIPVTE